MLNLIVLSGVASASRKHHKVYEKSTTLGYFISSIDLILDITLFVGFTNNMAALAAALIMTSSFIDANVKAKAHAKLED